MMTSHVELLKAKAMLLLRREQELYKLGLVRERTSAWLRAFHGLTLELEASTQTLRDSWVRLLIEELRFQTAAVMRRDPASGRLALVAGMSRTPIPPELALTAESLAFLAEHRTGMLNGPGVPALDQLAEQIGLGRFLWAVDTEYLIIAGFVPDTAGYVAAFSDEDLQYFGMLGRHLFVLLRNRALIGELHDSLATVRVTQAELAARVSELVVTREQLVQTEKLAVAGELAGSVAHEVNNPLAVVLCGLDSLREYGPVVADLWGTARAAAQYLSLRPDPDARILADRLSLAAGSEQDTADTMDNVGVTIDSMINGVHRIAKLVNGFRSLADRQPATSSVVDVSRLVRELAEECGGSATAGPALVAMVGEDDLRTAVRGVAAFLRVPGLGPPAVTSAMTIQTDVRAGRPCVVVSDPDAIVSADDCRSIFDPRVRVDTRGGRTLRLDLDLALAYQHLLRGGAEIAFDVGDRGLAVRFSLVAASAA